VAFVRAAASTLGPVALTGDRLGKRRQGEGVGDGGCGSPEPMVDLLCSPNPRLYAGSFTGNLHSTTTPASDPSPVVLPMLFMRSSTGLAIPAGSARCELPFGGVPEAWREIVVLCRFLGGCGGARSLPFPDAVYWAARHSKLRALTAQASAGDSRPGGPCSVRSPGGRSAR
jgi:hypothetical protein